jgi:SAM-dependent methyltransferase
MIERASLYLQRTSKPALLNRASDKLVDAWFRTRTGGITKTDIPDGAHSSALPHWIVSAALERLALTPQDYFIDVGCGRGRVLCHAARKPLALVMGIDADDLMADLAEHNLRRLRGLACREWDVKCCYAESFNYEECTAGFAFNPFGPATLRLVLRHIRSDRAGKPFRLVFMNANHAQVDIFREQGWNKRYHGVIGGIGFTYAECPQ